MAALLAAGFGFGLDLEGTTTSLGQDGYFNPGNGASGGIGVAHGWGVEALLSDALFLRLEADIRVFGGAGRTVALGGGHFGFGVVF